MRNISTIAFRTLLLATFAVWFGGFTFYVSFVVPIGTEILGSARAQGFITQEVTHRLNWMCGIAVIVMLVESFLAWNHSGNRIRWAQVLMTLLIAAMLVGLVVLHPQLDALIDLENRKVTDRSRFYGLHRIYLWLCTFQWIAAWVWLILTITRWQKTNTPI